MGTTEPVRHPGFITIEARTAAAPAPLPREIYLEVTNRCNLACRTCPQYFGMAESAHDLSWERFLFITDQFPALQRVVLHGIGEPLLNPYLGRMIRHLKSRGVYVLFNSNGLLLRGRKMRDLADSGLDDLRISIDGGTPATYQAIRGVDGFGRILANLRAFLMLQRQLAADQPRVSLWITGMKENVRDLPALVRAAADVGVREVYLQRLVFSERGIATHDQSLWGRSAPDERAAVLEAERLADTLGVTLRGSGELGPDVLLGEGGDATAAPWRACYRPWRLMYITVHGTVLPCCIAPFTTAPYADSVLGHIARQRAEDIWDGEAYRTWRTAMLDGAPPAACQSCGVEWSL